MLNTEVLQHLSKESTQILLSRFAILVHNLGEVETQINQCIEATVEGLVDAELDKYIPKELREDINRQRTATHQLNIQIHNSLSIPRTNIQP